MDNLTQHDRRSDRRSILLLIVVVGLVFGRVCAGEFLSWDEWIFIVGNPAIIVPDLSGLESIWRSPENGLYIPVPYTVWWLIAQVAGIQQSSGGQTLNSWFFHSANLLAHGGVTALVYCFFRQLRIKPLPACVGAMLFAIHPLGVETIAWALGLRDLLATIWMLAALIFFLRRRQLLAAVAMVLAVLCKPSAVAAAPLAIVIDWLWFGAPLKLAVLRAKYLIGIAVGGMVLAIFYVSVTSFPHFALWRRLLVAADSYAFYLYKLVLPMRLSYDYARTPGSIFASGQAYWTWLLPFAVLGGLIWARSAKVTAAVLLFVLPLLPVSGLVPFGFQTISTVSDHYAYPSLMGAGLLVAFFYDRYAGRVLIGVASVTLAVLAMISWRQAGFWHDDGRLFLHATRANPQSPAAWASLAEFETRSGQLQQAVDHGCRAVELRPDYAYSHVVLLRAYTMLHDYDGVVREHHALMACSKDFMNFDSTKMMKVVSKAEEFEAAYSAATRPSTQPAEQPAAMGR